ncbi:hypothetical protein D8B26_000379 [Coccidioides posadasii str. Silveira]|uniref:Uncharacterized protein n=1 Tax=Coccidioides posadasii (strain RMSCC 757 / Silveira) TaxID=443226 RepID=E9DF86_COCPS|nr:conserved hypothetical protein [Coccidioides posadasii str. Silveira]QVM05673.1 hypothetical protein D8B26_000379 [Coccidioides posadasii str. Silveira]
MEQWRERGYVPDSDDEDELDILRGPELEELDDDDPLQGDTGLFARSTTANKDSNIARLQASFIRSEQSEPPSSPDELHFDEHLPARAPARHIVKAFTTLNDDLDGDGDGSSSLSSPPSTITSPWSTKSAQLDQSRAATVEEHPKEDVIQLEEIPDDILPGIHGHHGRSLRQRNAIQLHPYLLENAQYQRLLKARGLQPVRVNIVDHAPQKDSDESQNQLYQDANALPSSSPDVSFHFPPSSPGPVEPTDTRRPPLCPSSNQPQVVIRKYSRKTYGSSRTERNDKAWQSNKRRKISNSNEEARATVQVSSSQDQVAVVDNIISRSQGTSIFDVPLSPPPSGSLSSAQSFQSPRDANEFRFPPGMTPPTVATPTTETRSRSNGVQTIFAELLSEAESENDIETVQQADSDSTPETSEAESTELRRIRRKIKGVLPASWLRLDLQEQEKKAKEASRKEALKFANRQRENAKGIARKISRTGNERINTGGSRATAFLISDDSGSDVELVGSVKPSYHSNTTSRRPNGLESLVMDLDDEADIPEDNRIDYMYPAPRHYISSDKRVSLGPKGGRKRENNSTSRRTQGSTRKPRRQARITDTISRRDRSENKVPRIPRLGILDAPDLKNRPSHCQPQFLRVAARCARRRRNYARQSQSRKFFRLGNRDDTQDINETLRAWRNGTIAQNCLVSWESTKECPGLQIRSNSDPTLLQRGPSDVNDSLDVPMGDSPSNRLDAAVIGRENIDRTFHQHEMDSVRSRPATTPKAKQSRLPRHGFVVSSFKRRVPRPVEMDSSSKAYVSGGGASFSFQKTLSTLNADYRQLNRNDRLPLARFLSRNGRPMPRGTESILPPKGGKSITQTLFPKTNISLPREPRKRRPQHIDSEAVEYRQPLEHDFNVVPADSVKSAEIGESRPLRGLHPTLQWYTVDFDTFPLQAGTYFHESTFIGSGEFARSLNLLSRDLDRNCGQSTIFDGNHVYRWGTWNDTLSSELGTLLERIVVTPTRSGARHDHAQASSPSHRTQLLQLYRSVILFASDTLSFSDPVDRKICVERCLSILSILRDGTRSYTPDIENLEELEYSVQIEMFNLVLANQIQQIASHELIASRKALEIGNVMSDFASRVLQMLLSDSGTYCIRKFLEENKRLEKREAGIRQEYPLVDAYLVTRRIIYGQVQPTKPMASDPVSKGLWALALDRCLEDIRDLERIWRSLFSLLPLQEFDELGIFRVGLRFKDCQSHWGVVAQLISKVFEIYKVDGGGQSPSFNRYVRALFHRCFHLIKGWGWQHCIPILENLFDFFARNLFHNLRNEPTYGSPTFLNDLDKSPALDVDSSDTCFHIFLKIVATALRSMTTFQDKKKIRNIAWRLLPNHGRVYPKDQPLREEDLDALRNHHDLLCTLYWSVPDGCRPRPETIRHLVHPATSHKEACSINIHAWSRLVRFKLSTGEEGSGLMEFANWHSDFTVEMLKQHSLARTELENAVVLASTFARQSIENAITKNQRQIESLINSALTGMKKALETATTMSHAMILMEKLPIEKLLGLFNPSMRRLNGVVCQTLELLHAYTAMGSQTQRSQVSVDTSEDSQDYGDWTGFEEIYDQQMNVADPAITYIDTVIRPALSRFVSRVFGEDQTPDDSLLTTAIDTWVEVANVLVKHRLRQWDSYLNLYDGESWASLRMTDQTRRFMPYFLASLICKDSGALSECRSRIFNHWIESLVERGSLLKFQHSLTTAILNGCHRDPLLDNLPFSVHKASERYAISLDEFCQRRISLLSCLLSNMREHLTKLEERNQPDVYLRSEYCEIIRTLMAKMRRNYEELGSPNGSGHGSYVGFVHRVVEFLQQHSQSICPIDEFFMDPTTFPLPASDPTYVVAKIKSYGTRLSVVKIAKQLVMFVQNVSERAAVDGHQVYLVDQVYKAMHHTYSEKDHGQPYLRSFLLQCVFPAYVENAFSNPVGWILVRPLLQSTSRIFLDLLLDVDTAHHRYISLIVECILAYFVSVDHALRLLTDHPGLLEEASVLLTLISFLETILASLPLIDYLYRISESAIPLVLYVSYFKQFILFAVSSLFDPSAARAPDYIEFTGNKLSTTPAFFKDIREFATKQLQKSLRNDWSLHNGQYFVRRGMQSKTVIVDPACLNGDVAMAGFVNTAEVFFGVLEGLQAFSSVTCC